MLAPWLSDFENNIGTLAKIRELRHRYPVKKIGRPPEYSNEDKTALIKRICGLIIQSSVETACAEVGIAESTFYAWIASDPELAEEYARARLAVSYAGEAELERINRRALDGEVDPKAANVASQNVRWLMGRRNPKVYGDKFTQENTGPNGGPIAMTITWEGEK